MRLSELKAAIITAKVCVFLLQRSFLHTLVSAVNVRYAMLMVDVYVNYQYNAFSIVLKHAVAVVVGRRH